MIWFADQCADSEPAQAKHDTFQADVSLHKVY